MLLKLNKKITIRRKNSLNGVETIIYSDIDSDIQKIDKTGNLLKGDNSFNSELADFYVFIQIDKTNLKNGDFIDFTDEFGENIRLKIASKEMTDFEVSENYIEILCKLL